MAKIKNTFHLQIMDKETDRAFVKNGSTRHSENLRFGTNGANDGIGTNIKGTLLVSDLTDANPDFKCIGALHNESNNTIYYMLATTDGVISKIAEYRIDTNDDEIILHDETSILGLIKDEYITGINEIDGLLFWSQWGKNPRRINIERAKGYGVDGYTEKDIQVIVIPPHNKPTITLQTTPTVQENNIEEKFLYFAYRWKYLDGEYSVLSPFSNPTFLPKDFLYDFIEQNTASMVNRYNQILIEFDTGNERVTEIQLVFKESESNTEWIIDDFNKERLFWGNNEPKTFTFDNSKVYRALDDNVLRGSFDAVPLTSKAQTIINGRLLLGNYKEQYDIKESIDSQTDIEIDYSLELVSLGNNIIAGQPIGIATTILDTATHATTIGSPILTITATGFLALNLAVGDPLTISVDSENAGDYTIVSWTETSLVLSKNALPNPTYDGIDLDFTFSTLEYALVPSLEPKKTAKSNRGYEVGIIYLDTPCRATTILVSKTNTLYIPASMSVNENSIDVILKNKPPFWAKYYRFFIKQNKKNYNQISPIFFYEEDSYVWVKLERGDIDKVTEGDYLIVKADTVGIKSTLIKAKVLEVVLQEQNFLEPKDSTADIIQKAGLYFKLRPRNFTLDISQQSVFSMSTSDTDWEVNILNDDYYISLAHFYGDTINDMSTISTGTVGTHYDGYRYLVEIDGTDTINTFRWSKNNGIDWVTGVPITAGIPQHLISADAWGVSDIEILFSADSGHSALDNWAFFARSKISEITTASNVEAFYRSYGKNGEDLILIANEKIRNGAIITLTFNSSSSNDEFSLEFISQNNYDNIQEWYYRDDIGAQIEADTGTTLQVLFARGTFTLNPDVLVVNNDPMIGSSTMIISRVVSFSGGQALGSIEIIQSASNINILFETEGDAQPQETYFEIGKTYDIINGYHISDNPNITTDQDQTISNPLRVRLDWFNAFSYGNGSESYKIKDEFNRVGIDLGVKTSAVSKEKYKEIIRKSDVTWTGVYQDDSNFNGLSTFNLSTLNWISLDKEEGSIQLLHNANGNLMVFQEDALGLMPYNKNVIYDTEGGRFVGVSTNVLDTKSYSAYAQGRYGTRHPESFVSRGSRKYIIDQARGKLIRISVDGVTPISDKFFEHYFSILMAANRNTKMVAGYDPKHGEYLFNIKNTLTAGKLQDNVAEQSTYSFKEKAGGFPTIYTFDPEFILEADNEVYAWDKGKMYKLNATENRNEFFGVQYSSVIKFFVNQEFSTEKVFNAIGIESTHAWLTKLKTKLTSRDIPKEAFTKIEDYWFSNIMGNTNNNEIAKSSYGLGSFEIVNGEISTSKKFASLSIGDYIHSSTLLFTPNQVIDITDTAIILNDTITEPTSFLIYSKNQNIDGSAIRGDVLEVEMISDETEKVELRAVNTEISKSNYS